MRLIRARPDVLSKGIESSSDPSPRAGNRRRWVVRAAAATAVLAIVAAGALVLVVRRIESDARSHAETGMAALTLLGRYQSAIGARDLRGILACYAATFDGRNEGDWVEHLRSDRDGVRVYDWSVENPRSFTRDDLRRRWAGYLDGFAEVEESKFKLDKVEAIHARDSASIRSILWLRGRSRSGSTYENHVTFRMTIVKERGAWAIRDETLLHGETVAGARAGFADIAKDAGICFAAQHNPDYLQPRWAPKKFGIMRYATGGVTCTDYDKDGLCDIFFCDGKSPRLYRNLGAGRFADDTEAAGLPGELHGVSVALFVDLDNDGDKDLFLGRSTGENRLYRHDGAVRADGGVRFTDVTATAGVGGLWVSTAAAADYDNDGLVDLYLGRYLDPRTKLPTTIFYTRNGEGNTLLRNQGGLTFRDVTRQAGAREGGLTLGLTWADYDNDGDQDLYVANDFGRDCLFRNNGDATFTDASAETGAIDHGYGMGAEFADINNDGRLDLYVSNVHSSQRWYGQAPILSRYALTSLRQGTIIEDFPLYIEIFSQVGTDWKSYGDRVIKGNSLWLNDGRGRFRDVAEEARANPFGWFWGVSVFDYDNDGRQDVYAANGWITSRSTQDL